MFDGESVTVMERWHAVFVFHIRPHRISIHPTAVHELCFLPFHCQNNLRPSLMTRGLPTCCFSLNTTPRFTSTHHNHPTSTFNRPQLVNHVNFPLPPHILLRLPHHSPPHPRLRAHRLQLHRPIPQIPLLTKLPALHLRSQATTPPLMAQTHISPAVRMPPLRRRLHAFRLRYPADTTSSKGRETRK